MFQTILEPGDAEASPGLDPCFSRARTALRDMESFFYYEETLNNLKHRRANLNNRGVLSYRAIHSSASSYVAEGGIWMWSPFPELENDLILIRPYAY